MLDGNSENVFATRGTSLCMVDSSWGSGLMCSYVTPSLQNEGYDRGCGYVPIYWCDLGSCDVYDDGISTLKSPWKDLLSLVYTLHLLICTFLSLVFTLHPLINTLLPQGNKCVMIVEDSWSQSILCIGANKDIHNWWVSYSFGCDRWYI